MKPKTDENGWNLPALWASGFCIGVAFGIALYAWVLKPMGL